MDPRVMLIAAAVGLTIWGGKKVAVETNQHVIQPAYRHVIHPAGCGAEKVFTLGHKGCAPAKGKK